jgi:hypothetical protein
VRREVRSTNYLVRTVQAPQEPARYQVEPGASDGAAAPDVVQTIGPASRCR